MLVRSKLVWLALALIIVLVVCGVFRRPLLVSIAQWLDVGEAPRRADYVMVLPGGNDRRPFVASAMVRAGLASGVLTARTETVAAVDQGMLSPEDAVFRQTLILRGIREDQIVVLPGQSNSTWTDALALNKFMQEHPEATIAITTDNYHTRRSRWVFQKVLRENFRRVFFVSAPVDKIDINRWWETEEGLSKYISEYFKLFAYVITEGSLILSIFEIMLPIAAIWYWINRRTRASLPVAT